MMYNKISIFSPVLIFLTYNSIAETIHPTDIVGRDLNYPFIGFTGHIGIATADKAWQEAHYVIEALNDPYRVIQINSLNDFKRRSPYWGAKFGINKNDVSGTRIINEGAFQASLRCAEYTYTVFWRAGTGQWGIPTTCPMFRCDTLVNYLYWWGGYILPTYNSPDQDPIKLNTTYPRMVFNLFPYYRHPRLQVNSKLTKSKFSETKFTPCLDTINDITEKQLSDMSFSEFTSAIDLPTGLLTRHGIDNLLTFADDQNLSLEKRLFLLDKLGFVGTPSMLPKLIQLYYKNKKTPELQHMILRDTQDIYQETQLLVDYPEEKQLLKEFYDTLLDKNAVSGIDPIIIRGLIALSTNEELLIMNEKLTQPLDVNKNFPIDIGLALKIALAFKSQELEELYIPNIIESLERENNLDLDTLFTGAVVGRLTSQGLNSMQMKSKTQINRYLSSIQFKLNTPISRKYGMINTMTKNDTAIPQAAGMWLESKALVNASSYQDASKYVARYLASISPKNHKKYIMGLSNSLYMRRAFNSEPILMDFKKSNYEFYQNTIGVTSR